MKREIPQINLTYLSHKEIVNAVRREYKINVLFTGKKSINYVSDARQTAIYLLLTIYKPREIEKLIKAKTANILSYAKKKVVDKYEFDKVFAQRFDNILKILAHKQRRVCKTMISDLEKVLLINSVNQRKLDNKII